MLAKIRKEMKKRNINAVVIINNENEKSAMNLFYATGFKGSSGCTLITEEHAYFITDFRYDAISKEQVTNMEIVIQASGMGMISTLVELLRKHSITEIFVDNFTFYSEIRALEKIYPELQIDSFKDMMLDLRAVKTETEVEKLQKACNITDEAFKYLLTVIKPGMSERELAFMLEQKMLELGADSISFNTIAVSGASGASPHGVPSDKLVKEGELMTFDFGCYVEKYASDMTRTIAIGKIDDKLQEIYNVVLKAQLAGVAAVKAGVKASEVDKACRDIITEAGYGEYFGHGTGHGLGIDVHELPNVSMRNENELVEGNVVTIEPGIYLPGIGGVRIEDDVVVTKDGCKILNKTTKELITV